MIKKAIYPGTFDPITYGHLDIVKRALKIFDEITIVLAKNNQKETLFTIDERISQIKQIIKVEKLEDKVKVDTFNGLVVDYCKEVKINVLIRGLRPLVDFEYEFEMAMANRELNNNVETIFILTDQKYFYLRSTLIKDIIKLQGDISEKVPEIIKNELLKKYSKEKF
jgi:pantetheine-phosphate adenylyltransferase